MKEIIYLDTNFLNSFMAQTHRGLPSASTHEQFEQDTRTDSNSTKRQSTHDVSAQMNSGSVNIPFISVSPNGTVSYKYSNNAQADEVFSLTQIDAGKEIISKQLHDNSLIEFESYLEENGIETITEVSDVENLEDIMGKFVKVSATFSVYDLDYLKRVTNSDSLLDIMRLTQGDTDEVNDMKKMFEMVAGLLDYLSRILPTNLFLRQGRFVAALKKEYLRESSNELSFKYGSGSKIRIHALAKVTREFDNLEVDMFDGDAKLKEMSGAMNGLSEMILSTVSAIKKGDIILSPVAIYFE